MSAPTRQEVLVVPTGTANRASIERALERLGRRPVEVRSPEVLEETGAETPLVLPGVGSFGAAMESLRERGLVEPLRRRLEAGLPTLAVCVGLQLLAEGSEESPGVPGLGLLPGIARRLPPGEPVPRMGWSRVEGDDGAGTPSTGSPSAGSPSAGLPSDWFYFAHSYALRDSPGAGWRVARARHGGRPVAAVARGRVLGCQFHPELSGPAGQRLLAAWLEDRLPAAADASLTPPAASGVARRVAPCLDVDAGRVVKGVRFQGLRDVGDPVERALAYQEQGADELVLLDVSATPEGRRNATAVVAAVRARLSVPLTVGGGVRRLEDAARLLDAGADKVAVNTAAVARPALLGELAARYGAQCTVVAVDARRRGADRREADRREDGRTPSPGLGRWEILVRSGGATGGRDALEWIAEAVDRGAGEVLLTSWDRDGTRSGYDVELLTAATRTVASPVIASGGAAGVEHFVEAFAAGADAVLAAGIFHDGTTTVADIKRGLAARGVEVRS